MCVNLCFHEESSIRRTGPIGRGIGGHRQGKTGATVTAQRAVTSPVFVNESVPTILSVGTVARPPELNPFVSGREGVPTGHAVSGVVDENVRPAVRGLVPGAYGEFVVGGFGLKTLEVQDEALRVGRDVHAIESFVISIVCTRPAGVEGSEDYARFLGVARGGHVVGDLIIDRAPPDR